MRKPRHFVHLFVTVVVAVTIFGACKDSKPGSAEPASQTASLSADATAKLKTMLGAYENIRRALASDEIGGAIAAAGALEGAANAAASDASASLREHVSGVAQAAARLKAMPATDAAAVRKTFGDVSRPLVSLLAAEATMRAGQHVFECPMAQGFKKWVQPSDQISNPYMGMRMPTCGSEGGW